MKKYACHRLYDTCSHYHSRSVVCINDEGKVEGFLPLAEEMPATEWIGGVIFLSGKAELSSAGKFKELLHSMVGAKQPLYAWHISGFDFIREELVAESRIRRL